MIDLTRNSVLTEPEKLTVLVIGVGATGSNFVEELVKLGIGRISVVDPGEVKEHNLTNQLYTKALVGLNKAEALNYMMTARYSYPLDVIPFEVDDFEKYDVIFNCVDIPDIRSHYRNNIYHSDSEALYIETAFDVITSDVFLTKGNSPDILKIKDMVGRQEDYGNEGSSEVTTACGAKMSVSASISQLIGTTIWKMIALLENGEVHGTELGVDVRWGKYTISINSTCFYSKFPETVEEEFEFEDFTEFEEQED